MKQGRRYSRTTGMFALRRWSEAKAMKATEHRFRQIDGLLIEIAGIWGDEDEYICRQMDELRQVVTDACKSVVDGHAELAEQRRQDRNF